MMKETKIYLSHFSLLLALDLRQSPTWISVCQDCPERDRESKDFEHNSTSVSTEGFLHFGNRKKESLFNRPKYELYNLENDPEELNNLADSQEHQEELRQMKEKIKDFQHRTGDPRLRLPTQE